MRQMCCNGTCTRLGGILFVAIYQFENAMGTEMVSGLCVTCSKPPYCQSDAGVSEEVESRRSVVLSGVDSVTGEADEDLLFRCRPETCQ